MAPDRPFTMQVMQELFTNHELLAREAARPREPAGVVRRVGILGGGTAGWMTALALRAQLPWLEVTLLEAPSIPIIGVGEASVPSLVAFIHHYLKIPVLEFTHAVKPTWKQGIRFEWGLPEPYVFQAPFDWEVNGVGALGSIAETGDPNRFTLQSILMARDVTPVLRTDGRLQSFLPLFPFAYHLDNQRLVAFLKHTAIERGVRHGQCEIKDAPLRETLGPDGEPEIAHLTTTEGQKLEFDLYIDCSGFHSTLLGKKLGQPFTSYASSLFTDSALAFNAPHDGKLKPYTTARTMPSGWCWNIPMVESDHLGYVHSSAHCSPDQALSEARALWPNLTGERMVHFRSGRHERLWVGNVFAIGNSYAFVEPLESTGLLMITRAITSLVRSFPITEEKTTSTVKRFVNSTLGRDWDRLRWFLAAHYKFNRRLDTPFWTEVRETADVSGIQPALDLFQASGPLSLLPRAVRASVLADSEIFFYGLAGLDCILLGQQVPFPKLAGDPSEVWRNRLQLAVEFSRRGVSQVEALKAVSERPDWLEQLVNHPTSWVTKAVPYL